MWITPLRTQYVRFLHSWENIIKICFYTVLLTLVLLLFFLIKRFFFFFLLWILKPLLNLLQFPFYFVFAFFFVRKPGGILASQPGIQPVPSALEGKVPTTELPGKSGFSLRFMNCWRGHGVSSTLDSLHTHSGSPQGSSFVWVWSRIPRSNAFLPFSSLGSSCLWPSLCLCLSFGTLTVLEEGWWGIVGDVPASGFVWLELWVGCWNPQRCSVHLLSW